MRAIQVQDLRKVYRYYPSRAHRLKEWASFGLKSYATEVEALGGISFDVLAGEAVGVIGRNGAGKSTLLRLLAGISSPSSGVREVTGTVAAMIELGAQFHPDYTGRENLLISGIMLGLSRKEVEARLPDAMDFAHLGEQINHPLRTYSSGMQARLAFAASTLVRPDVLLVDEVLAVGDQSFVGKCVRYIQEFHRSGRTLIFVSHDVTLMRALCQRVLWVDRGRLIADGPAGAVTTDYLRHVQEEESAKFLANNQVLWALRSRAQRELSGQPEVAAPDRSQISITEVRLLDGKDTEKACFLTGESLTIRIAYASKIEYQHPNLSVTIERADGLMMTHHSSQDANVATGRIEPGEGSFDLVFPTLLLGPGSYRLHVAITLNEALAYGDTNFDRLERVQAFSVMAASRPYPVALEHPVQWKRGGLPLGLQEPPSQRSAEA